MLKFPRELNSITTNAWGICIKECIHTNLRLDSVYCSSGKRFYETRVTCDSIWILWRTTMMSFLPRKSCTDNTALLSYQRTQLLRVIFKHVFIAYLLTGGTEHLHRNCHSQFIPPDEIKENCPKHAVFWSEVISLFKSENQSHVLSSAVSSPKRYQNI